jgi:hypothetical protein
MTCPKDGQRASRDLNEITKKEQKMMNSRFTYLKMTAAISILAVTLIPTIRQSTAKSRPTSLGTGNSLDLANEERILAKYHDDLVNYNTHTRELGKRARLVNTDLDEAQNRSEDLKRRLSEVQNAVREIVRKLKAADQWSSLDSTILAQITDAGDKSYFQQNSFRKFLEDASNDLTSYGSEISSPLDTLRKKLASRTLSPYDGAQIVQASYRAPTPFTHFGLQCLISNIQVGLVWRVNGKESTYHQNQRICSCSGGTAATCTNATT